MDYRVKIGNIAASLPMEIIDVGWDSILVTKKDNESRAYTTAPKSEFEIGCKYLPISWVGAGNPWDIITTLDNGCTIFQVEIEIKCSGAYIAVWQGEFSSKDWKINHDQKIVTVTAVVNAALECLKRKWTEEVNIYDISPFVQTFPYYASYEAYTGSLGPLTPEEPCPMEAPVITGFCFENGNWDVVGDTNHTCYYQYHRLTKQGYCDGTLPVPPDPFLPWEFLSGGCPGTPLYWTCPDNARVPYIFNNGRKLADVFQTLINATTCGLIVVSDFLSINPDDTHPVNDVYTYAINQFKDLVVFQKSDVKRHDASDPSRKPAWKMKLKDLIDDLKALFNLDFEIVDNLYFRIEHVSYFEAQAGPDYSNEYYTRELQQDKSEVVRFQKFKFRDDQSTDYFTGLPIETYCGEGEGEKRLSLFSTDLDFITNIDNAESVGDDGWVLVAPALIDGNLYTQDNNRSLAWTELHDRFYRHEMAGSGTINGEEVIPTSIKKTRKQPNFLVAGCCDEFDLTKYITTDLGEGIIDNCEWSLGEGSRNITLKY